MRYFADCKVTAKKYSEKRIFIPIDAKGDSVPELSVKSLYANTQFRLFLGEQHTNKANIVYKMYKTQTEVFGNTPNEEFEKLIEDEQVELVSSSEIFYDTRKSVKKGSKTALIIAMAAGFPVLALGSAYAGYQYFRSTYTPPEISNDLVTTETSEDGMLIPLNNEIDPDAEQITVSLDRSYSAVPKDDIQLKGVVVDGYAEITLPDFDKDDFFLHVPGYTYGFSTVKDADKIEYYGGKTYKFDADTKLYRVLVKYGGGTGTREDPYLISYYDQLELMAQEKARGYFRQICDIDFPDWATHTPIDTVNELKSEPNKESFEYDGGGYIISHLDAPLFGKVSGAKITDVNIKDAHITTSAYKNYGLIVCEAYNYKYSDSNKKMYETGETLIRHCSVSHSSISIEYPVSEYSTGAVVPPTPVIDGPASVAYDDKGNPITTSEAEAPKITLKGEHSLGAVSGLGGQIEDCYVAHFYARCEIDKYYLYAGGISGKPANVVNSMVNDFSAYGKLFYAGGIAGTASGARKYDANGEPTVEYYGGNIKGCTAMAVTVEPEFAAGGIAGEATTNALNPVIANCYTYVLNLNSGVVQDGVIKKAGYSGGIIGSDGQNANGHTVVNSISPAELKSAGNIFRSVNESSCRLAPPYAYYQTSIYDVLNANSVDKNEPKEIFTGNYVADPIFSNDSGNLPFPDSIYDLFSKTVKTEEE